MGRPVRGGSPGSLGEGGRLRQQFQRRRPSVMVASGNAPTRRTNANAGKDGSHADDGEWTSRIGGGGIGNPVSSRGDAPGARAGDDAEPISTQPSGGANSLGPAGFGTCFIRLGRGSPGSLAVIRTPCPGCTISDQSSKRSRVHRHFSVRQIPFERSLASTQMRCDAAALTLRRLSCMSSSTSALSRAWSVR